MNNPEEVVDYLKKAALSKDQINAVLDLGYLNAPASKGHHLAVEGGLAEHSMRVTNNLLQMGVFKSGPDGRGPSAYRVGMLHDLVKCLCYRAKDDGTFEYVQPPYPGHGIASVLIASDCGIFFKPEEQAAIVWHMGVFGLGEKEMKEYREATRRFPVEVILTHAADHLASVMEEVGGVK